jgi:urease gamma subunit
MRINGKILIAIIGFVFVAAGGLGLSKLGGFALIKEFFSRNAAHQATAADVAKDVQPMKTAADVAKDVQAMKDETKLPKTLDDYTELVDIRADGQAVVFVHRLTFAANPSKAYEFLAAVRTDMLQRACSNKGMPKAMNEGVVFRYQYADSVGFNVGSFDISGNDCA